MSTTPTLDARAAELEGTCSRDELRAIARNWGIPRARTKHGTAVRIVIYRAQVAVHHVSEMALHRMASRVKAEDIVPILQAGAWAAAVLAEVDALLARRPETEVIDCPVCNRTSLALAGDDRCEGCRHTKARAKQADDGPPSDRYATGA